MPAILENLQINRVDLVDEGSNSAAFIQIYKNRKEQKGMGLEELLAQLKPEHAEIVKAAMSTAAADIEKAKADLKAVTDEYAVYKESHKEQEPWGSENGDGDDDEDDKKKKPVEKAGASFDEDETLTKAAPEVRRYIELLKSQKIAAEAIASQLHEQSIVAKAKTLKALPVKEEELVNVLKSADAKLINMLETINTAIEATVLTEIGKSTSTSFSASAPDAWGKIEAAAADIAKRDSITKQKAIGVVIKERPELYQEYLKGGAN
jgi:hypothetical protein